MFPASYSHHKCCLVNSSCKGRIRMPGYTSVNTPPQWLTISRAKQANIHSQPRAKILKLCFRSFPKVRAVDEGHARAQCRLCGKEVCGKRGQPPGQGGAFLARLWLWSSTCLRPRNPGGQGSGSRAPRAVPCLLTGSTEVLRD